MERSPEEIYSWISPEWFSPSILMGYTWDNILFLYLIPVVPFLLLIRWAFYFRYRQKFDISFSKEAIKGGKFTGLLRFIPYIFMVLFVWMVLVALARPQNTDITVEKWSEGIDIVLVMDISESMELKDLKPNRLEAAKDVAIKFIDSRPFDRIGLVVFSGGAYSLSPLTTDHDLVKSFIRGVHTNMINEGGTAIGTAVGVGINRLRESSSKTKVMILISDGENTTGQLDPVMAAKLAGAFHIKIYSIGIGKEGKVLLEYDKSGNPVYVDSHLDESLMTKISESSEGKFFRANNKGTLDKIFLQIDTLEKGKIRETRFKDNKDYYTVYLFWGLIFFFLWLFTKSSFISNALED
ncbi:MAG: VWA domain-containing protein [Cytophagaceae bacterium]